jgi:hypothetical protein
MVLELAGCLAGGQTHLSDATPPGGGGKWFFFSLLDNLMAVTGTLI